MSTIKEKMQRLKNKKASLKKKYNLEIKNIDDLLEELQEKCFHERTEYYPDASGNNDSHHECLDCGKEDKYL